MVIKLQSTEEGIKLTNSEGTDLMDVLPEEVKARVYEQKNRQFNQTLDGVKVQVVSHDVISFDIFDTLITRKVPEPEMVFDLVGRFAEQEGIHIPDFRGERIKAQLESGLNNANLDEIYDQLAINTKISKEQAEILKQEELKTERRVVTPRKDMVALFRYALIAQKKVYLTTDMYLNRRYIVSLLNSCNISGYYDILDSCEYRKLKLEGLFEELKRINPGKSVLHIGDSYINDCICAEVANVDSLLISKGTEIAERKKWETLEQVRSCADKIMVGSLISYVCNSPFPQKNTSQNYLWFDIGYLYIGPIVLSFIAWLWKNIPLECYDGILLTARDGYLLSRMFTLLRERKILNEKIEPHYFYTSRKAAVAMHTDEESVINMLVDKTAPLYLPDRMLREVFCMPEESIRPYDADQYGENRYQYVWDQYKEIKDNVYLLKRNFYRYLGKEKIKPGGKYLLYDFVSSGTVHRSLSTLVPFELDGVYVQFTGEKDFKGNVYSRFPRENRILSECYKIMENLMLSPEPSLWGYDAAGKAVFCAEKRTEKLLAIVDMVHQGAILFADQYLNSFKLTDALISDDMTMCLIREMKERIGNSEAEKELIDDWLEGR